LIEGEHRNLLGEDVPSGLGGSQAIKQPGFLIQTEERTGGVKAFVAFLEIATAADLVGAILTGIEDV